MMHNYIILPFYFFKKNIKLLNYQNATHSTINAAPSSHRVGR